MKNKIHIHIFVFIVLILPIIAHADEECIDDRCDEQLNENKDNLINDASTLTKKNNIEFTETYYGLSLDDAVDIQANASAPPITSWYSNKTAFVSRTQIRFLQPANLYGTLIDVKKEPSQASETAYKFYSSSKVFVKDIIIGDVYRNSPLWYEIGYEGKTYYIHLSHLLFVQAVTINEASIYERTEQNSHVFGTIEAGSFINILNAKKDMLEINYQYWRMPKPADIKHYLDPYNNHLFQFVRLDQPIGVSAEQLNNIIEGKGILDGLGQAFIDAAKENEVNDAYLIAHSILETGSGTSPLATGIDVGKNEHDQLELLTDSNHVNLTDIKTTYNMYGIGAVDSCPEECGAIRAYESGWFSPEDAIINGAKFVSEQYIYNEFSQNTLYKMKWNPFMKDGNEWKQYATDIGWAEKQTNMMTEIYEQLDNPIITIDIPIFE